MDLIWFTLWLFYIAIENGPFIDGLPINSMVIFQLANWQCHNQMVTIDFHSQSNDFS